MSDIIELAKEELAAAELLVAKIAEELDHATHKVKEWQSFIEKAELLEAQASGKRNSQKPALVYPPLAPDENGSVRVQANSLVGQAAKLVLAHGPLSLDRLVESMRTPNEEQGPKDFRNAVNSALWRRQDDLFMKKDNEYHLRTQDIEFVE